MSNRKIKNSSEFIPIGEFETKRYDPVMDDYSYNDIQLKHDAQQHSWRIDQILKNSNFFDSFPITVKNNNLKLDSNYFNESTITDKWMKKFEKEIAEQFHIDSLKIEVMGYQNTYTDNIESNTTILEDSHSSNLEENSFDSNLETSKEKNSKFQIVNSVEDVPIQESTIQESTENWNKFKKKNTNYIAPIEDMLTNTDFSIENELNRSLILSKIEFLNEHLQDLQVKSTALQSTIDRLKEEIQINEDCETLEEKTEQILLKHPIMNIESDDEDDENLFVEDEDLGALVIHSDDELSGNDYDDLTINDSVETSETSESKNNIQPLAYKIVHKKQELLTKIQKIKEEIESYNLVLYEYRKEKLKNSQLAISHRMKESHSQKWLNDTKALENEIGKKFEEVTSRVTYISHEKDFLFDHLQFVQTQTEYCQELLKKIVDILKGKQEIPTGVHLSVSRALQLYSQLKDIAQKGHLDIPHLKAFLSQHENIFGITIPDFKIDELL